MEKKQTQKFAKEELIENPERFEEWLKIQLIDAIWKNNSAMAATITELMRLFEIKI